MVFRCLQILCVCLTTFTLTLCDQDQDGVQQNSDASYEFGYDIHDPLANDIKSHHEVRDGKNVKGYYSFKEADGSIRIVKYKVGPDTGFEAVVEKIKPGAPIDGNSIVEGQETAQSTHGTQEEPTEPDGGHRSSYVQGVVNSIHSGRGNDKNNSPPPQPLQRQVQEHQNFRNRNNFFRQRHAQEILNHQAIVRQRNPHNIRNRSRYRNEYQPQQRLPLVHNTPQESQYSPQQTNHEQGRRLQETAYPNVPRDRYRHQYIHQEQEKPAQQRRRDGSRTNHQEQTQHYTNSPDQPEYYGNAKIVYIDGVPYVDNSGTYDPRSSKIEFDENGQPYMISRQVEEPQYEVQENPEKPPNDEAVSDESHEEIEEDDNDKEEYEEEEDDDEDHENYEEEENDEDEDADASDFYEQNKKIIEEQQKEYDRLNKAYEEDGEEVKAEEPTATVEEDKAADPAPSVTPEEKVQ